MDFTYHYSQAQENFRTEVSAWLDANLPPALDGTVSHDPADQNRSAALDLRRRLGEKGWLAPTEPVEYGGLGASQGEAVVLAEEMDRRGLGWLRNTGTAALTQAFDSWASKSHSMDLITAINQGRVSIWHTCINPEDSPAPQEASPDSMSVVANEDGDDYVLDGRAWFSGPDPVPDHLWTLAHLDAEHPPGDGRPGPTISLLVPAGSKGISRKSSRRLVEEGPRQVEFDQVRVPRSCLLALKGEGWNVMHSTLKAASEPTVPPRLDAGVVRLQKYAEETTRQGLPLIQEPVVQQMVMDAYIDGRIARLFHMRDAWMRANGQKITYQPAQTRMWQKRAAERYSRTVRQVVGVYALLDENDPRAPAQGNFELQQRQILVLDNPAGVSGSDADIIARHLGMADREKSGAHA